jgi:hypothetical protein
MAAGKIRYVNLLQMHRRSETRPKASMASNQKRGISKRYPEEIPAMTAIKRGSNGFCIGDVVLIC